MNEYKMLKYTWKAASKLRKQKQKQLKRKYEKGRGFNKKQGR